MSSVTSKSNFKVTRWDAQPYVETENGPTLSRVEVDKIFTGDIEAEATAILLTCGGPNEGDAGYIATDRVTGRIGNRHGSFVLQHGGATAAGQVVDTFGYVVPGSATGDLTGLRGHCSFLHEGEVAVFTLEYELP